MPVDPKASVEAALVDHFGQRPQRASVSFLGVEPIDVLRFEPVPGERAYLSSGMARHPMTPTDAFDLAQDGPRAELMLHLLDPTDRFADVWRRVALLAAAPAVEGVVYAPDMTLDIGEPLVPGSHCTGVVVTHSPVAAIPLDPAHRDDGPVVEVFQIVPATPNELAWARVRGAAALRELWRSTGTELTDLLRMPAPLG